MTKRRAIIRGRGAEVPLEEQAAVRVEPRLPKGADRAAAAGASWLTLPDVEDPDLERALYEEARAGAPLPAPAARSLPWEEGVLASPELEAAMIEEAFAAEESPELLADQDVLYEPPPAEVDDISAGVLPPRLPRQADELNQESPLARDIQEPETEVKPIELPGRDLSEEQRQAILSWWGDARIQQLSADIDAAYEAVRLQVGDNEAITTEAYNQLLKARDILIRRDADRIAQAEYYIEQVQVRLKRAAASEAAGKRAQWPLMIWGLLWGVAYLAVLILGGMDRLPWLFRPAGVAESLIELDVFLSAMLWGGIGGSVAVLYSLFKHIGKRDFDRQYVISYVGKPFLGLIVGATVYMIVALVVRALGIVPGSQTVAEVETAPAISPGVIYLVAWAAGFKENHLLGLVDRLMKQVFGASDKKEGAASATKG